MYAEPQFLNFANDYERELHEALDAAIICLRSRDHDTYAMKVVAHGKRVLAKALKDDGTTT